MTEIFQQPHLLHSLLHYPIFISENKSLLELFQEFRQKNTSFAIVVDEHGAVRGVVTSTEILNSFLIIILLKYLYTILSIFKEMIILLMHDVLWMNLIKNSIENLFVKIVIV